MRERPAVLHQPPPTGRIYTDPVFRRTLLKFRAISGYDSNNDNQTLPVAGGRARPRDIITTFAEWLRYGGECIAAAPPGTSPTRGWLGEVGDRDAFGSTLDRVFDGGFGMEAFDELKKCFPRKLTGTGVAGRTKNEVTDTVDDYLAPKRLLLMTIAIEQFCHDYTQSNTADGIFLNTLERPFTDGSGAPTLHGRNAADNIQEEDENVFIVFSGMDIEVNEVANNDVCREWLAGKRVLSHSVDADTTHSVAERSDENYFSVGSEWFKVAETEAASDSAASKTASGASSWGDILGPDFDDDHHTHKILGVYIPKSPSKKIKVVMMARNTYNKLEGSFGTADGGSPQPPRYIILKTGRPGHYTIGLLDLSNYSIEYFDSEGAIANVGSNQRRWGLKASVSVPLSSGGQIDIVTPCTFPLQTDNAASRYWEDGFCQSWVWLYIYERLQLKLSPSSLSAIASEGAADVAETLDGTESFNQALEKLASLTWNSAPTTATRAGRANVRKKHRRFCFMYSIFK